MSRAGCAPVDSVDNVDNVDSVDSVDNVDNVDNVDDYHHHLSARQDCHYLITRPPPQGFHFKGAVKRDLIVLLKKRSYLNAIL